MNLFEVSKKISSRLDRLGSQRRINKL